MQLLNFLILIILSYFFLFCNSQEISDGKQPLLDISFRYFDQKVPEDTPVLFAPGKISTKHNERDAAWSPLGKEFCFSLRGPSFYTIIMLKQEENLWSDPEVAPFSGKYSDIEPCYSPDGQRLYFASNRPLDDTGKPKDFDIWFVQRQDQGWGTPQNVGSPVNTAGDEYYPSFSKDGTIYYTASYEDAIGGEDLYYSKYYTNRYKKPVNLGDSINTEAGEFNACISPDGSWIIFTSMGWGAGEDGGDLWISFRKSEGSWSRPRNLGKKINTPFLEYCPSLSPDGKYLFFASNRSKHQNYSEKRLSYQQLMQILEGPQNGNQDIYWVESAIIESLKPR
jgi:Tol biopolymer transport system component